MSKYKIENIIIQNFKCIEKFEFNNFELNDLIVFDGPNGYGKTTVFEAIEILLTEKPRKFRDVKLDARYTFKDSPIHKNNNKEIILELILNDETKRISIKRKFPPSNIKSKSNNISHIFNTSILFLNDIETSYEELEKNLDFNNLNNLFSILNYVEQDENTFFLKKDPKDRYHSFLQSLLGGEQERLELEKIILFQNKILQKKDFLIPKIQDISKIIMESDNTNANIVYKRIIKEKEFDWDNENITILSVEIKNSYLLEINKLSNLLENKSKLKDIELLSKLNNYSNLSFYEEFLNYYWSSSNFEILEKEYEIKNLNKVEINKNNEIINKIQNNNYPYFNEEKTKLYLKEKFELSFDIEDLFRTINNILILQEGLSIQDRVLSSLKDRRNELLNFRNGHRKDIKLNEGECPTCGFDWKTNEELLNQIEITELKIFNEYKTSNMTFESLKEKLNNDFFKPIISLLLKEIEALDNKNKNLIEDNLYFIMKEKNELFKNKFRQFLELIEINNRNKILEIVNHRLIENFNEKILKINELINLLKPKFPEELDINTILSDFEFYFDKSIQLLDGITNNDLIEKQKYINLQFSISINSELQNLNQKLIKYDYSLNEIEKIKKVYDEKIKEYTNDIINKISIPFHIYTGKILQNHSLGSGLSINFETIKNAQIYITPNYRDQEVAYLLSSGQLSATVISLMLVLNKVFNHSKLGTIFIDDPLQTLDEINTHSLVELLRYNFGNQQLFLSTHEDRYSKFIRYKYEKFGLNSMSVNMKDNI